MKKTWMEPALEVMAVTGGSNVIDPEMSAGAVS